ncbi:hypothetical protein WJX82_005299 [Trebouxia sp. C0006]
MKLVATAGRTSQLLSCDDHGRLYAATTDSNTCADTRNMSGDLQRDQNAKAVSTKEVHVQKSGLKTLTGLAISGDGTYAVLAGASTLAATHTLLPFGVHFMDDDDVDDNDSRRRTVSFAFGPAYGWERFTVLFVCSNSSLFSLCPVAPFHATISSSAVAQLLHAIRDEPDAAQSTTHAWLNQALSKPVGGATSCNARPKQADSQQPDSPSVSALKQSMIRVQPHALDNHVPPRCGLLLGSDNLPGDGDMATGHKAQAVARHYVAILSEVRIAPPAKNLSRLRDILCTQTYLHLTYAMLCTRKELTPSHCHGCLCYPQTPTGTGNPEGQKLLTEWIGHLRQTRVEFTHVAHHDLMHILQELPRLAAEQEQKCEEMGARLMDLQDSQQKTEERLERATKVLDKLHWRLLHALNAAEEVFRDKELPEVEEQAKSMRKQIKAMQARASESRQADQENAQAQNGSSAWPNGVCAPTAAWQDEAHS